MERPDHAVRRRVHVNVPAAAALAAVVAAAAGGYYALASYQEGRMRREALGVVRRLEAEGNSDLALRHLDAYLGSHAPDVESARLKARLMDAAAGSPERVLDVARAYEQLVRLEPPGPGARAAHRRLAELYVRYGDYLRLGAAYYQLPELATLESRYHAAERHARELLRGGDQDPSAHRLLATALEGLAVPGDVRALNEAVREYRVALQGDPADAAAAGRLADLYLDRLKDPARAERVLDDLRAARPDSVETRLARHRFFARLRRDDAAAAELDAALALEPGGLRVVLAAAEHALRRGDTAAARARYEAVPAGLRGDARVALLKGMIEFTDERPSDAVEAWRRGLLTAAGTDAELTWWLAHALLQLDRVAEARPLVDQYRRLAGGDAPLLRLLVAQLHEHTGRPALAVRILENATDLFDDRWRPTVYLDLGRCHEAVFDALKAGEAYRRALKVEPTAVVPRLALARLALKDRPGDAVETLRSGLAAVPDDPALLTALAGALLRVEAGRPAARRDWSEFDAAFRRAASASPAGTALALLWADRLALAGRAEESLRALEGAAAQAPAGAAVAVALADALTRRGRTGDALRALDRASAPVAACDTAALRVARARVLVAAHRGREARAALVRDVDRLPEADRPRVWVALGRLEAEHGDPDAADRAFAEWARLAPDDPRPRLVRLELAAERGDEPAVRAAVDELKALGGDSDVAYRLGRARALLFERGAAAPPAAGGRDASLALEEAARVVDSVLTDVPQLPAAQLLEAQVLDRQGRADEAIAAYERVHASGVDAALPRLVDLLARRKRFDALARLRSAAPGGAARVDLLAAQAFLRLGDGAGAARAAERVAGELSGAPEALGWQARLLDHLGRSDDAEAALRAAAERRPGDPGAWLDLIRYQAARRRTDAAAATAAEARARVRTDRPGLLEARCAAAAGDRDRADAAFAAARAARPDDVETLLAAARHFEDSGRPAQAEEALARVLRLDPANRPAARQLATALAARAGGRAAWDRAWAALGPERPGDDGPEDRLARAVVLSRCPDPPRRAEAVERLEALNADLPTGHAAAAAARDYLVRLLIESGRAGRASQVASVSAAAGADPTAIGLYAEALIRGGKPEAAVWQLDRLAAVSPGDRREAGLRARLLWDPSRPAETAAALWQAYSAREDLPGAEALGREAFALMLELPGAEPPPAAGRLARALAARNPALGWMPAAVLTRLGRGDEALGLLPAALRPGSPDDVREAARVAMTVAAAAADPVTLGKARAVVDAARALEPRSDDVLVMAAMLRHLQGRYDDEVRLYRQALARRPEDAVVLNNLAWALCEGLRRPDEALPLADALVRRAGSDPEALDTRGVVHTRLGRAADALKDLEEAVRLAPTPLNQFHLARAYRLAGRPDDARKARDRALAAGLTLEGVDAPERDDLKDLLAR